jgi:hypothetical protein
VKKVIEWMFGLVKRSPVLQGALCGLAMAHLCLLAAWCLVWLADLLPWPKA